MQHGPPTWTYIIQPFVSLVGVGLAYLLGNAQGQAQTRYDRATDALTRILALALEAEDYLETLRSLGVNSTTAEWPDGVIRQVSQLKDVYRSSRPWLSPEQRRRVDDVVAAFAPVDVLLVSGRDLEAITGTSIDASSLAKALEELDVGTPIEALDTEVTRLASSPPTAQRLWDGFLDWVARHAYPNARGRD
jgi:hypothetical protein